MASQSAVAYALPLRHCRPCALFETKNSSAINAEMNGFSENHFRLMAKLDLFIYSFIPQTSTKHLPYVRRGAITEVQCLTRPVSI